MHITYWLSIKYNKADANLIIVNFKLHSHVKRVGSFFTNSIELSPGVIQGSVIGSLVFVLYINDVVDLFGSGVVYKLYVVDLFGSGVVYKLYVVDLFGSSVVYKLNADDAKLFYIIESEADRST